MSEKLKTRFLELTRSKYVAQAKWFLNGFWNEGMSEQVEFVWTIAHTFISLDPKKAEGNELDEFLAHKFLETLGETLTVVKLREELRKIDLDANGKMALLEFLCFKYGKTVQATIDSPQGDNQEEVNLAATKLESVQRAMDELSNQLSEQKKTEDALAQAIRNQVQAENEQKAAEEQVRKSEAEQVKVLQEIKDQETTYKNQLDNLQKKIDDPNSSTVLRSKSVAEISQLKSEDPLPLRKAKISQEAIIRKVEKERRSAEEATKVQQEKTRQLEDKKRLAEEQTRKVEVAIKDTEAKVQEAQEFLEEVKRKGGVAKGDIFWMEREIKEAQKYLPKKKQTML